MALERQPNWHRRMPCNRAKLPYPIVVHRFATERSQGRQSEQLVRSAQDELLLLIHAMRGHMVTVVDPGTTQHADRTLR